MCRPKIAVFASGTGSNFVAITEATRQGTLDAEIAVLICDQPGAEVLGRASDLEVEAFCFSPRDYPSKAAYEKEVTRLLKERNIDLIALAGYMRIVGPTLLAPYEGRIVNIHPSLLPDYPGLDSLERTYRADAGGVTVHLIDSGIDTGPILAQMPVPPVEGESLEDFEKRVHATEHSLYPAVLEQLANRITADSSELAPQPSTTVP